ncbi:hypothetical protein F5B19DRAFT_90726 [Rostrohypoxylon terebratum]|nr:hypothetical protein F5B19DRAFT_90726 [Rostrohypoxylon terebratum]
MDRNPPNSPGVLATKPNANRSLNGNGNGNSKAIGIGRGGRTSTTSTQSFTTRRIPQRSPSKPDLKENITSDTDTSSLSTGSRHPLYSSPKYIPHSKSFSASSDRIPDSPRETRIPQPKSTANIATSCYQQKNSLGIQKSKQKHPQTQSLDMRQPLNLKSAFELAQQQEADDTLDDTFSIKHAFNMASAEMNGRIDGSPSPAPRRLQSRRQSSSTAPPQNSMTGAGNDLGRHLQQFDRNHQLGTGNGPLNGLFSRNRIGPKASETGNVLAKKASDNDLRGSPVRRRDGQQDAISRTEGHAGAHTRIPSIENQSSIIDRGNRASAIQRPSNPSPEKSFNWQLDADFTAGDLQISESPRIRTEQSNGKSRRTSSITSTARSPANLRRSNNKIDEIRQKEIEAANAVLPEEEGSSFKRPNNRLDEIRAREMDALSKRAMATSRLDEIRVRNSEAREESPEAEQGFHREGLRGGLLPLDNVSVKSLDSRLALETKEERATDTPTAVPRSTSEQKPNGPSKEITNVYRAEEERRDSQLSRNDSQDLLRRLARATSASPSTEKAEPKVILHDSPPKETVESRENSRSRSARQERRLKNLEAKNLEVKSSRERPTVGFAGLRPMASSDSLQEKKSSLHGSEVDPLDRIEAELRLFAPLDNYSEKGSVRAPSPVPSEPAEEETPRVNKIDPLTQPTPRVTGAYVETPATIRVKQENHSDDKKLSNVPDLGSDPTPELRTRDSSKSSTKDDDQKGTDESTDLRKTSLPRSSSMPTISRRARSASRRRQPPRAIINTAKLPTVKDDIRAILRMNQIDDSTLEDFDSILASQDIDDEELQKMMDDTIDKIDNDLDLPELPERDRELQIYDRMSKSLKTGLLGIQSAKKGIERLENRVLHTEVKSEQPQKDLKNSESESKARVSASSSDNAPVVLALPALYRKSPRFRLTKLGILALILSIWYCLESIFCALYTIQYDCTPDIPCDWSPNEPYFPYAMPFMLDEWATGGKGRALTWKVGEEVGDVLAEVTDWVMQRDFTQFDEKFMDVWERKRHRRRLRKHGLAPKWVAPADYRPRLPQWNAARSPIEDIDEDDYDDEYEIIGADEMIR